MMSNPLPESIRNHLQKLEGEVGFAIHCLQSDRQWLYHDRPFLAASTIKLPIMAAWFDAVVKGEQTQEQAYTFKRHDLVEDSPVLEQWADGRVVSMLEIVHWMMVVSDNTATNIVIQQLGLSRIQKWIEQVGLTHTHLKRTMVDQEARKQGIDNWTTPGDMCFFIEKLFKGELGSSSASRQMLEILFQQQDLEKIPAGFSQPMRVANKPGELPGNRSDVGLVTDGQRTVIMAIFCDQLRHDPDADDWIAVFARLFWDNLTDT